MEENSPDTNQRQQNDAEQGQQKGQIGPWDPGIQKNRTQITTRPHQVEQVDFKKSDKFLVFD